MKSYFYRDKSGNEIGPLTLDALGKLRFAGVLNGDTPVRAADSGESMLCRELITDTPRAPSSMPQRAEQPIGNLGSSQTKWVVGIIIIILAATIFFLTKKEGSATGVVSTIGNRAVSPLNQLAHDERQRNFQEMDKARQHLGLPPVLPSQESANPSPAKVPAALQATLTKAQAGDVQAQLDLGLAYGNGVGVDTNFTEANKWFRKAAEQGNARAQNAVGLLCSVGRGTDTNYVEAVKWFQKAADQGYANAQVSLGIAYKRGHGVNIDYSEAIKWFRRAVEQGNPLAEVNLGFMYQDGLGVDMDIGEAKRWFQKAADQGDLFAQRLLSSSGNVLPSRNACINNLRLIDSAKQQWALEQRKRAADTPTMDDLRPYLGRGQNGALPVCPDGGVYTLHSVGEPPTCTISGHWLP